MGINDPLLHGRHNAGTKGGCVLTIEKYLAKVITPRFRHRIYLGNEDPSPGLHSVLENSAHYNDILGNTAAETTQFSFVYRAMAPISAGSERGSVFTLIGTALGSGVLSLPFAMSRSGVILTMFLLCLASMGSILGLTILIIAGRYTEERSIASLLGLALRSPNAVPRCVDLFIFFYGLGSCTSLYIFLADFVPPILSNFGLSMDRHYIVIIATILAWPLCIPKRISALRYVSIFSVVALMITTITVCINAPYWESVNPGAVELVHFTPINFLQTLSICIFGFMCHMNALPVGSQLQNPTASRIVKVATRATLAELSIYFIIGIGGYVSWKELTMGDFLLNYPATGLPLLLCRSMLSMVAFIGIVMNINPTVGAIEGCVFRTARVPTAIHIAIVTVVLCITTTLGACLKDVATLIGIMGGSFATILMFLIPAVVYWRILWRTQPRSVRQMVIGYLAVMTVLGFSSAIANAVILINQHN
eukprot:GEMP01025195.1.p1 GENE.GEMP01025195.1~~GEMP01025195.1.p1  ORF type:complete len:478 (+),score=59.96 GEMP01025195.1:123-1556(+)